jgi:hypothetical protein
MTRNPAPVTMPAPENGTVPRRPLRVPEPQEPERLIAAARQNRPGHRDATLILV